MPKVAVVLDRHGFDSTQKSQYHDPPRIPAKPGEQPRSQKYYLGPSLLMKMNVGERGRMPDWCPWPESNQHSLRNSILSRARLPIPPQGLVAAEPEAKVAKPAEYSGR